MTNVFSGHQRSGFTLVELLVAITILAMVAMLGWRGLDSIIRARTAITDSLQQTREVQLFFAQLHSDCAHAVDPDLLVNRPVLNLSGDKTEGTLTMVRSAFLDAHPSGIQVVTYRWQPGIIMRYESIVTRDLNVLDQLWQRGAQDPNSTSFVMVKSSKVNGLTIRLWDSERRRFTESLSAGSVAARSITGIEVGLQQAGTTMDKWLLLGAH